MLLQHFLQTLCAFVVFYSSISNILMSFHKCDKSADCFKVVVAYPCILCTTSLFRQTRIMLILPFCTVQYAFAYVLLQPNVSLWTCFASYGILVYEYGLHFLFRDVGSRIWLLNSFLLELAWCSTTRISSSFIFHSVFLSAHFTGIDFMFTSSSTIKYWTMLEVTMPMGCQ